uniref:TPX2 central domain-containing protein n=1 Tax=Physcomitrium patens TaxID=3218 RepID=A0A7I4CN61_PHYPA
MEKVVDTISRYPVIDPKYEFSAPQYVDFSHEESHGDIDRADQWFSSAIPNEASPHAPRIGSVIELLAARDRSRQASDKEARKILAHVSHGPRQTNEQVTIGWEQSSEFEVAPESLIVDWLGEFTATTIPALSPVTSPMPTKRSYAEVCDESAHPPETMRKKTELADIRWSYNDRRDKAAARKAQVSEEFQAGKRQKLDRGRTKQIMQRCPSLQEPREVSPFVSMAERVQKFLHKTPPRFHVLPARVGISQLLEMEKPKSPKLTMPKTPEFQTMRRIRSSRFKSAEEIEIEELAKIPKFKARPLNKRVFQSSGDLGLLRIHKRKVTVPMEFRSETSRRAQVRNSVLRIQEFDKEQGLVKLIRTVGSTVEREQKDAGALISEVQYILSK